MTQRGGAVFLWLLIVSIALACEGSPAADPADEASAPTAAADPAAVHPHEVSGIEVTLVEVRRGRGDTVTIRWRYRNSALEAKVVSSADGEDDELPDVVTRAFLMDEKNGKKYLVLRDADDRPVITRAGGETWPALQPGESVDVWAHFPVPPDAVAGLSFHVPGTDPFQSVTVAE